jgi:lipid II:glycine glycyltransferase (peptidoglycan interpeptide bridge formation enzyme)
VINPWFGGTLNEFVSTEAGSLIYWEIMKYGSKNGYKKLDFLGLDIGPIAFYKKGFGGTEVPVYHLGYSSLLYKVRNKIKKWGILKVI